MCARLFRSLLNVLIILGLLFQSGGTALPTAFAPRHLGPDTTRKSTSANGLESEVTPPVESSGALTSDLASDTELAVDHEAARRMQAAADFRDFALALDRVRYAARHEGGPVHGPRIRVEDLPSFSWKGAVFGQESEPPIFQLPEYDPGPPEMGAAITPLYLSQSDPPGPDDLAATIDVQLTPEVRQLAASLGNDPVAIYEYVRNEFEFEAYRGSRRGSTGTLWSGRGNDYDLASLLIALYRSAGIPCRYVLGVVTVPVDDAMSWLGVTEPSALASYLSAAAIPAMTIISEGKIEGVALEHVWVEAYVPYSNYRGAGDDDSGKLWVPLDPSFKRHEYSDWVKLPNDLVFNRNAYLAEVSVDLPIDRYRDQVRDYLFANAPGKSLLDVPRRGRIIPEELGMLPGSLPYRVERVTAEVSELPDEDRDAVVVRVIAQSGTLLTAELLVPDVATKRVTIGYESASSGWQPVLRKDGTIVATGATTPWYSLNYIVVTFFEPDVGAVAEAAHLVMAGGYHALALDAGQSCPRLLGERGRMLLDALEEVGTPNEDKDATLGEFLYLTGMRFFEHVASSVATTSGLLGQLPVRRVGEALVSAKGGSEYRGDRPYSVLADHFTIDVRRIAVGYFGLDGDHSRRPEAGRLSCITASALEHRIWEETSFQESISAVKALQIANSQGMPVYEIDSTNVSVIMPLLSLSSYVKQEIQTAVNRGLVVTAHKAPVTLNEWTGAGWIEENPVTGSGWYKISGNRAGGEPTTDDVPEDPEKTDLGVENQDLREDPTNVGNGNQVYRVADIQIGAPGIPINFVRAYNSRRITDGPFGYGWTHSYAQRAVEDTDHSVRIIGGDGGSARFELGASGAYTSPVGVFDILTKDATGFTLLLPGGGSRRFAATGELLAIEDRYGNTMTFGYDVAKRLTVITDPVGRRISLTYDASGHITQVTDFAGRVWRYSYNGSGELIQVTDPMGYTEKYTYGTFGTFEHLLTGITDANGNTFQISYYADGRVSSQTNKVGYKTSFYYLPHARQTIVVNSRGFPYTITRDEYGNTIRETDAEGNETLYEYNDEGLVTKITSPLGAVTRYVYDESNPDRRAQANLLEERLSDGPLGDEDDIVTTFTYEPRFQQIKTVTSPLGNDPDFGPPARYTTTYYYDYEEATLGDLNGDGRTDQAEGNVVRIRYPRASVYGGGSLDIVATATYNDAGQVLSTTDPEGYVRKFEYYPSNGIPGDPSDREGYLWRVTNDFGVGIDPRTGRPHVNAVVELQYNLVGDVTARTDPNGGTTTYTVDQRGLTTKTVQAAPFYYEARFWHDGNKNVTRVDIQNDGENEWLTTRYEYDAENFVTKVEREVDATHTATTEITYDGNHNVIKQVSPGGLVETREYDARDIMISKTTQRTRSDAATMRWSFDPEGQKVREVDALGRQTLYTYDGFGRLVGMTDALGHQSVMAYDPESRLTRMQMKSPAGTVLAESEYRYDELGRRVLTRRHLFDTPGGPVTYVDTISRYDAVGRVVETTNANGHAMLMTYDGLGRVVRIDDPVGNRVERYYDPRGNLIREVAVDVSPEGLEPTRSYTTHYAYDSLNRLIRTTDSLGGTSTYNYDALGRLTSATDAEGNTTRSEYDGLGRLLRHTLDLRAGGTGSGAVIDTMVAEYSYDLDGKLTAIKDDNGHVTELHYGAGSRPVLHIYADGTWASYQYDVVGNLIGWRDANGTAVTITYDALNRVVAEDVRPGPGVAGPTTYRYEYDGLGRLVRATNGVSEVSRKYDSLGRILEETVDGYKTSYTYDKAGNRTSVKYPSGLVLTFTYDNAERLKSVRHGATVVASYDYVGASRIARRVLANGTVTRSTFDGGRRLTGLRHTTASGGLLAGFQYGYDRVDNRRYEAREHDSGAGDVFTYDSAYRLVDTKYGVADPAAEIASPGSQPPRERTEFKYDGVGNRLEVRHNGVPSTYVADEVNAYTVVAGVPQTYDANGNLTDDGARSYVYDHSNRLVHVESGGHSIDYQYDPLGRRIGVTVDGNTVRLVYDGDRIIEERSTTGALLADYVYGLGLDEPVRMRRGGNTVYYHANALGSVAALTDSSGRLVERYAYQAYGAPSIFDASGAPMASSSVDNPYMFTGRWYEAESGLYDYRQRHYDPQTGRFISRDPGGPTDSLNLYEYVRSNPASFCDPHGLRQGRCGDDPFVEDTAQSASATGPIEGLGGYSADDDYASALLSATEAALTDAEPFDAYEAASDQMLEDALGVAAAQPPEKKEFNLTRFLVGFGAIVTSAATAVGGLHSLYSKYSGFIGPVAQNLERVAGGAWIQWGRDKAGKFIFYIGEFEDTVFVRWGVEKMSEAYRIQYRLGKMIVHMAHNVEFPGWRGYHKAFGAFHIYLDRFVWPKEGWAKSGWRLRLANKFTDWALRIGAWPEAAPSNPRQWMILPYRKLGAAALKWVATKGSWYLTSAQVGWSVGKAINAWRPGGACGPTIGESIQETLGFNKFWSWWYSRGQPQPIPRWQR